MPKYHARKPERELRKSRKPASRRSERQEDNQPRRASGGYNQNTFEGHVQMLGDPKMSHPSNSQARTSLVSQLQRDYGNRYVQRVINQVSLKRQAELQRIGMEDDEIPSNYANIPSSAIPPNYANIPADVIPPNYANIPATQGNQQGQAQGSGPYGVMIPANQQDDPNANYNNVGDLSDDPNANYQNAYGIAVPVGDQTQYANNPDANYQNAYGVVVPVGGQGQGQAQQGDSSSLTEKEQAALASRPQISRFEQLMGATATVVSNFNSGTFDKGFASSLVPVMLHIDVLTEQLGKQKTLSPAESKMFQTMGRIAAAATTIKALAESPKGGAGSAVPKVKQLLAAVNEGAKLLDDKGQAALNRWVPKSVVEHK